jgi:site-specific DNA-methyltransferase (adenine-specific)
LHGFLLFEAAAAVRTTAPQVRLLLTHGRPRIGVWQAIVDAAIESLGGEATRREIREYIAPRRPTPNPFWVDKVRQITNTGPYVRGRGNRWRKAA